MQRSSSLSVLIVRLDAIGDALVTVPLVAALRRNGWNVGAVLTRHNAGAFSRLALEHVHLPDAGPDDIAARKYDAALIPSEEPLAYAIARKARIPVRIGFEHGLRAKPFKSMWIRRQCTRTIYRPAGLDTNGLHESEIVYQLLAPLDAASPIPRDAGALADFVVDRRASTRTGIVLQVTDKWLRLGGTLEELVTLARTVGEEYGVRCVGAASEQQFIGAFVASSGMHVETFADLAPWKHAIASALAAVAPDSGATHVAGMTGTPVVAVYGRENFVQQTTRWRPWAAPQRLLMIAPGWPHEAARALKELISETTGAASAQ